MRKVMTVVACVAGFWACAHGDLPAKQLADAEATARAAEQANAASVPRAALHLQMSREHLAKAQVFIKEREFDLASRSLRRAKADADLALALAESEKATQQADEYNKKVMTLKQGAQQ